MIFIIYIPVAWATETQICKICHKQYLDDFYKTINNDKAIEAEFQKPCRTDVRIEIKGLKD